MDPANSRAGAIVMQKSVFSRRHQRLQRALIDARREANLTQVQLAKRLRRPQSFVSDYERGQRRLDVVELLEITRVLKLDPHELIDKLQQR
jgi:transcriptional regulator with XRE-family HTH domain